MYVIIFMYEEMQIKPKKILFKWNKKFGFM